MFTFVIWRMNKGRRNILKVCLRSRDQIWAKCICKESDCFPTVFDCSLRNFGGNSFTLSSVNFRWFRRYSVRRWVCWTFFEMWNAFFGRFQVWVLWDQFDWSRTNSENQMLKFETLQMYRNIKLDQSESSTNSYQLFSK